VCGVTGRLRERIEIERRLEIYSLAIAVNWGNFAFRSSADIKRCTFGFIKVTLEVADKTSRFGLRSVFVRSDMAEVEIKSTGHIFPWRWFGSEICRYGRNILRDFRDAIR